MKRLKHRDPSHCHQPVAVKKDGLYDSLRFRFGANRSSDGCRTKPKNCASGVELAGERSFDEKGPCFRAQEQMKEGYGPVDGMES